MCDSGGHCRCLPCFSGRTCSAYEDAYGPEFALREVSVAVGRRHEGVVYKAVAEDRDLGTTCPSRPPPESPRERCPCARVRYSILQEDDDDDDDEGAFSIDGSSGEVALRPGVQLDSGRSHYRLKILASGSEDAGKEGRRRGPSSVMVLKVVVLQQEEEEEAAAAAGEDGGGGSASSSEAEEDPLVRKRRFATGADGSIQDVTLTLAVAKSSPQHPLRPGNSIDYSLDISLPQLTTAMDLLVEIFVMDAVSGITPFTLCSVTVHRIGDKIRHEDDSAIDANSVHVDIKANEDLSAAHDRAVIDFGKLKNVGAFGEAETDFEDSTVSIAFTAVLVRNPNYAEAAAIVTAGAEYDSGKLVWVGQDAHAFDMDPAEAFGFSASLSPPPPSSPVAKYSGASFRIETHVSHPFEELTLEVNSPDDIADQFTVSQIYLVSKGSKWACVPDEALVTTYYPSASRRTSHRAVLEMPLLLKDLDYGNDLSSYSTDDNFKIEIGFNIFIVEAEADTVITVGVGLVVGTDAAWTAKAALTVAPQGPIPPPSSSVTWIDEVRNLTQLEVVAGGAATWAVTARIPSGANSLIQCEAIGSSTGGRVCGVVYGAVGGNIAYLPPLSHHVTYDAGSAQFSLNFNSTGSSSDPRADYLVLEISVQFESTLDPVFLQCSDNLLEILTVDFKTSSSKDVTGVLGNLISDANWYEGSQVGLLVTLTFTGGGNTYNDLILEALGDVDVTDFGVKMCGANVVRAGRGVPCIAGQMANINKAAIFQRGVNSEFEDGIKLNLGPACGTERSSLLEKEMQVDIKVWYELPAAQPSLLTGNYNMSVGLTLSDNHIWTGWEGFTVTAGAPSNPPSLDPLFGVLNRSTTDALIPGLPTLVTVVLKPQPGTVGKYVITAEVDTISVISICKVVILDVGSNFPCMERQLYSHKEDPLYPSITLTNYPMDWGLRATLDLGILRNLGSGTFYPQLIPDADAVVVGIILRGFEAGSATLTLMLDNTGISTSVTEFFTVSGVISPTGTPLGVSVMPVDSTTDAYEGVMKLVDFELKVPEGYQRYITATVRNTNVNDFTVCFGAVYAVGENIPCLMPPRIIPERTSTDTEEVLEIDLSEVCHYRMSENSTDDLVVVRVGVMFLPNSALSSVDLIMDITEGGTTDTTTHNLILNKLSLTAYNPGLVSATGMRLSLLENETVVTPGLRLWTGVAITIPKDVTIPLQMTVMAPSDTGQAYATVHGFRLVKGTHGKNLGCLLEDTQLYQPDVIQNSSVTPPLIHTSQTDTLVTNFNYITNTGITYGQLVAQPEDDQIWFQVDVWVANHPTAPSTINIQFAVQAADTIITIDKPLTLDTTASQEMQIVSQLILTNPSITLFHQGDHVGLTARVYHLVNESTQEANSARIRFLMPKYLRFVTGEDTLNSSIAGTYSEKQFLDFDFEYLFFTDMLEVNLTLTVDPERLLPKGLGIVEATTLLRFICTTTGSANHKYCTNTTHVQYQLDGSDCYEALAVAEMQSCQFTASTAIDNDSSPSMAKAGSGSAWCPAVRMGSEWEHHITIDFLRKTRITKIFFEAPAGLLQLKTFKMQYSHNAHIFMDACQTEIEVPASGKVTLSSECRFQARYGRLVVVNASDTMGGDAGLLGKDIFGVRFGEWYGCHLETSIGTCSTLLETVYTHKANNWRHAAYDAFNDILYFCDFSQRQKGLACFSTTDDGYTWNALPSYIGRLVGFDAISKKVCALDRRELAMVCSCDGLNWSIVEDSVRDTVSANAEAPVPIPGKPEGSLGTISVGAWTADFAGLSKGSTYHVKWDDCCV